MPKYLRPFITIYFIEVFQTAMALKNPQSVGDRVKRRIKTLAISFLLDGSFGKKANDGRLSLSLVFIIHRITHRLTNFNSNSDFPASCQLRTQPAVNTHKQLKYKWGTKTSSQLECSQAFRFAVNLLTIIRKYFFELKDGYPVSFG